MTARFKLAAAGLFLGFLAFRLFCAGGTLVPYRDAGEMVADAHTLGVAHPPGYPFYALAGKAFSLLPVGNPAYRLNVFSALTGAAASLLVFLFLRPSAGPGAALAAAALWAVSPIGGELSAVSEMYAPWLLALFAVLAMAWRLLRGGAPFREWAALSFLVGLGCGVRTDFALLAPAFLYLFWRAGRPRWTLPLLAFFALGLSVFLYLPLRSAQQPLIDWNNPEELSRLTGSLLRRSHGGTLDMLSKSYAAGENFPALAKLFAKSCAQAFSWAGLPLAALGTWLLARRFRAYLLFLALVLAMTGPVFLYLANMPPNPHAMAVVEAHYAAPHAVLLLLAGWGAGALLAQWPLAGAAMLSAAAAAGLWAHGDRMIKRWNFDARDYVTNLARSAPPGSIGVVREDVPLFGFWERTLTSGARPDLAIVAQGLAASPWYHDMMRRQGAEVVLGPLRSESDWAAFRRANAGRAVWAAGDVNLAYPGETWPGGLPVHLNPPPASAEALFAAYVLRGAGDQARRPEFFSSDLVAEYARAALREASARVRACDWDGALFWLRQARRFDSETPSAPFNIGYVLFQQGRLEEAETHYARASALHEEMLRRAAFYKSLPAVAGGLKKEASEVWVHRGVVAEKLGRLDLARGRYEEALRLDPASAQAHYNLAVTYWNRDWDKVVGHMTRAAELDPAHEGARAFLAKARALRGKP